MLNTKEKASKIRGGDNLSLHIENVNVQRQNNTKHVHIYALTEAKITQKLWSKLNVEFSKEPKFQAS